MRSETSHARLILLTTLFTVLVSVGVCMASVLAPAPAGALPLVVVICVGCPLFAAWEAPAALAAVRAHRERGDALSRMRKTLDRLPEVEHPLGL